MKNSIMRFKKRVLVVLLVIMTATVAAPLPIMAQGTPVPLTDARIESLTSFFAQFGGWFGVTPALGDYDVDSPEGIYAALEFVLSSRVFGHGREGILGYPHYGFVQYMGGERFRHWDDMPDGVWPGFEFITSDYVDSVLWSLFGISDFRHGILETTPAFGFWYHYGGYYYRALAQGSGDMAVIQIAALYDNGNGTYSVVLEYVWVDWDDPTPVHMQYNVAVIQPFADNTYQMLYWRNDVARDTPIPLRKPTSQQQVAYSPATQAANVNLRLQIASLAYTLNGDSHQMEAPPFIAQDRTMVPIRLVAEALGADVDWVEDTRTVIISQDSTTINLVLDVPLEGGMGTPVNVGGFTFVPVAFVAETLGANVRWDASNQAVYITN